MLPKDLLREVKRKAMVLRNLLTSKQEVQE
jgi:hypothetical protein